jgi:hypothetical protein
MKTFTQTFEGATIEVVCDNNQSTAQRIEPGQSTPRWSYTLSVPQASGSNEAYDPEFDLLKGTVSLHVCSQGRSGHDTWHEAWATISLVNGAVLYQKSEGG